MNNLLFSSKTLKELSVSCVYKNLFWISLKLIFAFFDPPNGESLGNTSTLIKEGSIF